MSTDLLNLANNLPFVDEVYAKYLKDPASVDASWRRLFEGNGAAVSEIAIDKAAPNGNGHGGNGHAVAAKAEQRALQKILPFTSPESTAGLAPSEARYGFFFGLVGDH